MEQWQTARGRGCEPMADILRGAFKEIGKLDIYYGMSIKDLADAIEFVTRGALSVEIHPLAAEEPMSYLEELVTSNTPSEYGDFRSSRVLRIERLERFVGVPNRGEVHRWDIHSNKLVRCEEGNEVFKSEDE